MKIKVTKKEVKSTKIVLELDERTARHIAAFAGSIPGGDSGGLSDVFFGIVDALGGGNIRMEDHFKLVGGCFHFKTVTK